MNLSRIIISLFLLAPLSFGANKDIQELQRDLAMVQDQVRNLQSSVDQKVSALQTLVQQTLDSVNRTNTAVAVMENRLNDGLKQQQQSVAGPVVAVTQKLDQMSEDFRAVRESVLDMNTRMGKLDAKMADLQNLINTIRTPPPPPPPAPGASPTDGQAPPAATAPAAVVPPLSADVTYTNASRDYLSGKYDLAMQEFNDYLKYYGKTQFAPNAQFYIGMIYLNKQDYTNALQAFDSVLEQYSDNPKTADAHYEKGMSLLGLGKNNAAAQEFREVYSRYPDADVAAKAKARLKDLGLNVAPAPSRTRRR
jgi:tol-pal system protein YbgF